MLHTFFIFVFFFDFGNDSCGQRWLIVVRICWIVEFKCLYKLGWLIFNFFFSHIVNSLMVGRQSLLISFGLMATPFYSIYVCIIPKLSQRLLLRKVYIIYIMNWIFPFASFRLSIASFFLEFSHKSDLYHAFRFY